MKAVLMVKNFLITLILTLLFLTLTNAEIISEKCIWKSEELGTISDEKFSDELLITTEIDQLAQFYAYYECNNADGSFSFFQLIVADRD